VVEFISEIFGKFDELTSTYNIYKVETVGDAYIAGQAEHTLTDENSPATVVRFGLEMVLAVHAWSRRHGEKVSCRVGVHHGDCIGGIVGIRMQRYHLFGRLMSDVEVLESTAPEGGVQVSSICKEAVDHDCKVNENAAQVFEGLELRACEKDSLTTSKGELHQFEEVGGRTFIVHHPSGKHKF